MKNLAVLFLLSCFPSLAHAKHYATSHDYCVDPENAAHYSNYDECYRERMARKKRARINERRAEMRRNHLIEGLSRAAQTLNRPRPRPQTTTCETVFGTTTCKTE